MMYNKSWQFSHDFFIGDIMSTARQFFRNVKRRKSNHFTSDELKTYLGDGDMRRTLSHFKKLGVIQPTEIKYVDSKYRPRVMWAVL